MTNKTVNGKHYTSNKTEKGKTLRLTRLKKGKRYATSKTGKGKTLCY